MGKHQRSVADAVIGRHQALDHLAVARGAAERAETEGADIAAAVEKTKRVTDAVWPGTDEEG